MLMTIPRLPQAVMDLRAQLSSSDIHERLDAIAPLVGLPPYSECPRPGLGGAWTFRQWCDWAKPYGFTEVHDPSAFKLEHNSGATFSMSKTPGDFLSVYASTTQFRRKVAERLDYFASLFTVMIDYAMGGGFKDMPETTDKNVFMKFLEGKFSDKGFAAKIQKDYASNMVGGTPADKVAWGSLSGVFKTLDKEFGVNVRQAMAYIGYAEIGDKMAIALKQSPSALPMSAIFYTHLRSYIETLRAIRVRQNEERTKARQAEKEARTREKSAGTREKYDRDVVNHRAQLKTQLAAIRAIAENLGTMTTRQIANIDSIAYPDYPGAPDELNAQMDAMKTKLEEAEEQRDQFKANAEENAKAVNRMESDLLEAQAKALHGNDDLAKKVLELTDLISRRLATTTDILSIGAAVKDVREASVALGQYVRTQHPDLVKPADTPKAK